MENSNGLSRSELYTLGIGIIIIIVLLFLGGKLSSPSRGTYTLPMQQSQSSQQSASAFNAVEGQGQNISKDPNIQIFDTKVGTGVAAKTGDSVVVHYTGLLSDGTKFDSSVDRGTPFPVKIGEGKVIKGWEVGLVGMKVGGKRRLIISPAYGYGSQTVGPIPANSTLVFDIELLQIQK
jgi:FKBP-type peptidyl-prolyl cis-trans isomerase